MPRIRAQLFCPSMAKEPQLALSDGISVLAPHAPHANFGKLVPGETVRSMCSSAKCRSWTGTTAAVMLPAPSAKPARINGRRGNFIGGRDYTPLRRWQSLTDERSDCCDECPRLCGYDLKRGGIAAARPAPAVPQPR